MKTFTLKSPDILQRAAEYILNLPDSPLMEVVVKPHKKDRSAQQNSLYWKWLTVIAGERGELKEDIHEEFKSRMLAPIFERDDPDGYGQMMQAIRTVYRENKEMALHLRKETIKLTSTTDCTVEQFTEYLNEIDRYCMKEGICLPMREEM